MLGVCWYPEQWPEAWWEDDARRMREMNISYVRIAEFAWSRIEPEPGRFDWAWLDRAIGVLHEAGLRVVMCTPTATPPKWLIDAHPDILPVGAHGAVRGFGSRRHTSFGSAAWWEASRAIATAVAERYGAHPAVAGWQIDNEFGCHDTVLSYGPEDLRGFRDWLRRRYQDPHALNEAWGNAFWSMDVTSFDQVSMPAGAVTELNPAARLDYWRFASDRVASYCAMQAGILRAHSPGRFVTHNFMGRFTDFDHWALGEHLDFATWDSYPLGFTEQRDLPDDVREMFVETGHPDMAGFHHDLYRGVGRGRWWVMEQQPGPVNWAPWNPVPKPGMVRLWAWEAFAHGAEVVSYFRWRQAASAQEQMHAGLHRPDRELSAGGHEAMRVGRELAGLDLPATTRAKVAFVFDYEAAWVTRIQPQGRDFDMMELCLRWYEAARRCGVDIDVVAPGASLGGYAAVLVPCLPIVTDAARAAFEATPAKLLFGPRTGSKTRHFAIPPALPPDALLPMRVTQVASLRPGLSHEVGDAGAMERWREWVEPDAGTDTLHRFQRRHARGPARRPCDLCRRVARRHPVANDRARRAGRCGARSARPAARVAAAAAWQPDVRDQLRAGGVGVARRCHTGPRRRGGGPARCRRMAELGRSDLVIGAILKELPLASILVVARAVPGWLRFHAGAVTYVGGPPKPDALPEQAVAHPAVQTHETIAVLDGLVDAHTRSADILFLHHALMLPHVLAQLTAARPLCHPRTLLLMDGAAPPSVAMTGARSTGGWFVGEIWMLAHLLRASPGFVATVAVWPTGLLAASGFEPIDPDAVATDHARLAAIAGEAAFAAAQPNLAPEAFVARCVEALADIAGPVAPYRDLPASDLTRLDVEPDNHPARRRRPLDPALSLDAVSDAVLLGHGAVLCGEAIWARDAGLTVEAMARDRTTPSLRWACDAAWVSRAALGTAQPLEGAVMLAVPTDPRDWRCWVRQVIPAAAAFLRHAPPGARLLAETGQAWQRRLLETLGIDPADTVPFDRSVCYACEEGWVLTTPGLWAPVTGFERATFSGLAQNFGRIGGRATRFQVGPANPSVIAATRAHGFGHIAVQAFALHDRIAMFARAELIVAVGISALIDVVFCRPDTRVIGCVGTDEMAAAARLLAPLSLRLTLIDDPDALEDWLGREDSNLRMAESKSAALPLGDAPTACPAD